MLLVEKHETITGHSLARIRTDLPRNGLFQLLSAPPLLRNLGISRGGGALTLEFPGERCINFKFPGEGNINLGISRGEGTLTLKFPGKGHSGSGIPRGGVILTWNF